jgi:hypothetical protein
MHSTLGMVLARMPGARETGLNNEECELGEYAEIVAN